MPNVLYHMIIVSDGFVKVFRKEIAYLHQEIRFVPKREGSKTLKQYQYQFLYIPANH